jgi:photosystem II stability/assembly factor-like uncharacterized protein
VKRETGDWRLETSCPLGIGDWRVLVLTVALASCQALEIPASNTLPTSAVTPALTPAPAETQTAQKTIGDPPGPVLTIAPLPDGQFLAGVGPIGEAETGFEWRLYRGRDDTWQRLSWPPEAIPRSLHPAPAGNLLFAVPFSNALFGRGQAWGLMRSTDGGRSWEQALEGLGDPYVMELAFSPTLSGPLARSRTGDEDYTMFVVTWYSGVYRSTDAGQSWEPMSLLEDAEVEPSGGPNPYDLAVAASPDYQDLSDAESLPSSQGEQGDNIPSERGLLMASFSRGLHRWDGTTQTWATIPLTVTTTVEDFDPEQAQLTAGAIAFSPNFSDDGTIYLYSGYAGLFRSTDRGETWQPIGRRLSLPPPFVADFHLAVASADEAYVLLPAPEAATQDASPEIKPESGEPAQVLYRTRDGGRSWEALTDPPTLGWVSAFALTRDEEGRVVLHLGGSQGGVSSHPAQELRWD